MSYDINDTILCLNDLYKKYCNIKTNTDIPSKILKYISICDIIKFYENSLTKIFNEKNIRVKHCIICSDVDNIVNQNSIKNGGVNVKICGNCYNKIILSINNIYDNILKILYEQLNYELNDEDYIYYDILFGFMICKSIDYTDKDDYYTTNYIQVEVINILELCDKNK